MVTIELLNKLANGNESIFIKLNNLCETSDGQALVLSLSEKGLNGSQILSHCIKNNISLK